jgi:hypothetical protein
LKREEEKQRFSTRTRIEFGLENSFLAEARRKRRTAVRKTYQGMPDKPKRKFEVLGKRELLTEVPLPMVEVWEELQAQVEQLTGEAGLRIIGTILENEVTLLRSRISTRASSDPRGSGARPSKPVPFVASFTSTNLPAPAGFAGELSRSRFFHQ